MGGNHQMKGELFFEILDDPEVMARLVESIPATWSWVDGAIRASKALVAIGNVEESTGFSLAHYHNCRPTIIGRYNPYERKNDEPNLFAIMVERRLPGFVVFNEAGYDRGVVTLPRVQKIAMGFLRMGYRGRLHFFRSCYDDKKYDNSATCEMIFQPWDGSPPGFSSPEIGPQPARVRLEWNRSYGGKEDDIAPIAAVCRSLGLREYVPKAPANAV